MLSTERILVADMSHSNMCELATATEKITIKEMAQVCNEQSVKVSLLAGLPRDEESVAMIQEHPPRFSMSETETD